MELRKFVSLFDLFKEYYTLYNNEDFRSKDGYKLTFNQS